MIDPTATRQATFLPAPEPAPPAGVPEWEAIEAAIQKSQAWDAAIWTALAACPVVTLYCDGAALIRDPGGPVGVAVVAVGKNFPVTASTLTSNKDNGSSLEGNLLQARLDLGAYVPGRIAAPPTSTERAGLASVLAALAVLRHLGARGWQAATATVWSDNRSVVECANRRWQRHAHSDLWTIYGQLERDLRAVVPHGVTVAWVQGHAGQGYNAVADELATRAALEFDAGRHQRYWAAQAATGTERPGATALARYGVGGATAPRLRMIAGTGPRPVGGAGWIRDAHYTLVVYAPGAAEGGWYQIWTRDGRGVQSWVAPLPGAGAGDEPALLAALNTLVRRIQAAGRSTRDYTVDVYRAAGTSRRSVNRRDRLGALIGQFKGVTQRPAPLGEIEAIFAAARSGR